MLEEFSERGYTEPRLRELQKLVRGEDSDLYDVLAFIAWHRDMVARSARAERARIHLGHYNPAQQEFLNFVLQQYVRSGVSELDEARLPELIELKYKSLADAKAMLGEVGGIREMFRGFQGYLYAAIAG